MASDVKAFLKRDVKANFTTHLSRVGRKEILGECSYMDPRFKKLVFMDVDEAKATREHAKKMCFDGQG